MIVVDTSVWVNALRIAASPEVAVLRSLGQSWATISEKLGIGKGTAQRAFLRLPKNPSSIVPVSVSA